MIILSKGYFLTLSLEHLVELLGYPQLQVIIVNANDDRVQIYYQKQVRITRVADLVQAMYNARANHGFLIRDATESGGAASSSSTAGRRARACRSL
jgi:hypothetical protein